MTGVPPLPIELAEPILAITVHLVAAASLWQPSAIAQPPTVLSRAHAPLVTNAALMQLPQVDMTWATKCGDIPLLEFMVQWSKQPEGRPLNYSATPVLALALRTGLENVLEWWLDKSGDLVVD